MSNQDDLDRTAVEQIRGYAVSQEWPIGALSPGTRVRVAQDPGWPGPWAQVFMGTVSDMGAPERPTSPAARKDELAYWIDFDEPQRDADGDGPYRKAHIWDRYLEPQ